MKYKTLRELLEGEKPESITVTRLESVTGIEPVVKIGMLLQEKGIGYGVSSSGLDLYFVCGCCSFGDELGKAIDFKQDYITKIEKRAISEEDRQKIIDKSVLVVVGGESEAKERFALISGDEPEQYRGGFKISQLIKQGWEGHTFMECLIAQRAHEIRAKYESLKSDLEDCFKELRRGMEWERKQKLGTSIHQLQLELESAHPDKFHEAELRKIVAKGYVLLGAEK